MNTRFSSRYASSVALNTFYWTWKPMEFSFFSSLLIVTYDGSLAIEHFPNESKQWKWPMIDVPMNTVGSEQINFRRNYYCYLTNRIRKEQSSWFIKIGFTVWLCIAPSAISISRFCLHFAGIFPFSMLTNVCGLEKIKQDPQRKPQKYQR